MTSYKASQFSLKTDTDESGEPEEEYEDDPEEEYEDDSEEEPEEDPEMDPEEDPEEEYEETDPEEELEEEESGDEPDEELPQGPSECLSSVDSKEQKSPLDATESNHDPFKSQKKFRRDEACNAESNGISAVPDSAAKQQENSGSSRKQRRSRWDQPLEQDAKISDGDKTIKRRKSRWASDDAPQSEKPCPILSEVEKLKQELLEIKNKLLSPDLQDDRPEGERSPSPPPEYDNLGQRTNPRQVRLRKKLINRQKYVLSKLAKEIETFKASPVYEPPKLIKKIYIPVKEFPTYNFVGLILGPRGNTLKRMEQETGAKILLRGKGSSKALDHDDTWDDDLHVLVEAKNQQSLDAAVAMVEKLLVPVDEQMNHHKRVQLEELAKLNGTYNVCKVCKEQGHKHYACPNRKSTFDAVKACTGCGSFGHLASMCIASVPKTHEISDRSLYVGFLPQAVDDNRLRELFCPFGKIVDVKVIIDRNTGVSKGYGFVNFESSSDAAMAVTHMNGHPMEGKMLAVRVAGRPQQGLQKPTGLPPMAYLPTYPISADTQSQRAWPGPPGSAPPEAQAFYPKTEGFGLSSSSSVQLGHSNHLPGGSILPSVVSSHPSSQYGSSFDSHYGYPNQKPHSPPKAAQFPGDPDYPGSQMSPFFGASTTKTSLFDFSQTPDSARHSSWRSS